MGRRWHRRITWRCWGVTYDSKMTFIYQIELFVREASGKLALLRRMGILDKKVLEILYKPQDCSSPEERRRWTKDLPPQILTTTRRGGIHNEAQDTSSECVTSRRCGSHTARPGHHTSRHPGSKGTTTVSDVTPPTTFHKHLHSTVDFSDSLRCEL